MPCLQGNTRIPRQGQRYATFGFSKEGLPNSPASQAEIQVQPGKGCLQTLHTSSFALAGSSSHQPRYATWKSNAQQSASRPTAFVSKCSECRLIDLLMYQSRNLLEASVERGSTTTREFRQAAQSRISPATSMHVETANRPST